MPYLSSASLLKVGYLFHWSNKPPWEVVKGKYIITTIDYLIHWDDEKVVQDLSTKITT
jgi:hypothetical protein